MTGEGLFRELNPNWRGGRSITSHGYVLIKVGQNHHLADVRGYAYEHRLVAEEKLGRLLRPGERVRHVNGVKDDNRPENIESRLQLRDRQNETAECACGCSCMLTIFDRWGRERRFIPGHNNPRDEATGQFFGGATG